MVYIMYNSIIDLLTKAYHIAINFDTDMIDRLKKLEDIANDYVLNEKMNTEYSCIDTIEDIIGLIISDIENDFYTDEQIYEQNMAELAEEIIYEILNAFSIWGDEIVHNSYL